MGGRAIALAAESWFGSTTYSVAQGFRRLGWEVIEINTMQYVSYHETLILKVAHRLVRPLAVGEFNRVIRERVALLKPSALVTVRGNYISRETLRYCASLGVPTVNYYPDVLFAHAGLDVGTVALYTHVFTTKSFHVEYLQELLGPDRVTYLPHGYSPDVHVPPPAEDGGAPRYDEDILHVGTPSRAKERWLSSVRRRFPDRSLVIYGANWGRVLRDSALRGCYAGQEIFGTAYARALARARINLAVHFGQPVASGWEDRVSTRTFEIPACKGFMLHIDNDEVRRFFTPGEEIDVFRDEKELHEKIDFYLGDEARREEMIERAYRRCVPAYSYDERARVIADWISRSSRT